MTNPKPAISPGLRFLLSAACVVVLVAGIRAARTILVPLALALFVAVISLPLLNLLRRIGIPTGLAVLFVVVVDGSALFLFGWLVSLVALEVRDALPGYLVRLEEIQNESLAWLNARGIESGVTPLGDMLQPERIFEIVSLVVRSATDVLTTVFLVTLIFVFMLAEASSFPRKLRVIFGREASELGRSTQIVKEIQHYLAIKTIISVMTGFTVGVATWFIGLDFPLLWGILAFLLNYIPNVGSIIAAIPAVTVALIQLGPGAGLLVAGLYVAVNAMFGSFLEPLFVGRQLGISTVVIILSLIFWGWMWGPIGMFLSVPLTMALKIGLEHSDEFRWIAYLMTAERKLVGTSNLAPVTAASVQRPNLE